VCVCVWQTHRLVRYSLGECPGTFEQDFNVSCSQLVSVWEILMNQQKDQVQVDQVPVESSSDFKVWLGEAALWLDPSINSLSAFTCIRITVWVGLKSNDPFHVNMFDCAVRLRSD